MCCALAVAFHCGIGPVLGSIRELAGGGESGWDGVGAVDAASGRTADSGEEILLLSSPVLPAGRVLVVLAEKAGNDVEGVSVENVPGRGALTGTPRIELALSGRLLLRSTPRLSVRRACSIARAR